MAEFLRSITAAGASGEMLLDGAPLGWLGAAIQVLDQFVLYPGTTFRISFRVTHMALTSLSPCRVKLLQNSPAVQAPRAAFRTRGTAATSARSPNIPGSARFHRNQVPGTYVAAQPRAAFPARRGRLAGSPQSGCAQPFVVQPSACGPALPWPGARRRPHPLHGPSRFPSGNDGCRERSSTPDLWRCGTSRW